MGQKLASNLRTLLDKHGLRAMELASKIGIPYTTLSRVLTGVTDNPTASTMIAIAGFFNVTIDSLLGLQKLELGKDIYENLHSQETLINKSSKKIPVFPLEETKNWIIEQSTGKSFSDGKPDFIHTEKNFSKNSFAVRIDIGGSRAIFPKGSVLIVEPREKYFSGDYVVASIKKRKPTVRVIASESGELYLNPIFANVESDKLELPNLVFGKIIECRIYY